MYAAHQAFTAIAAGADYAAPYLGRMNDAGKDVSAPANKTHAASIDHCVVCAEANSLDIDDNSSHIFSPACALQ